MPDENVGRVIPTLKCPGCWISDTPLDRYSWFQETDGRQGAAREDGVVTSEGTEG